MSWVTPPGIATRLEKAAVDNGFDRELPRVYADEREWLVFASTQAPLQVWFTATGKAAFFVALSQLNVARALGASGGPLADLPPGATAVLAVPDIPALHLVVRRAFQLSRTLPDELLRTFEQQTLALPRATEAERLVIQRVGQDVFRNGLLEFWEGRCAITGLAVPELLRASHIKPWADCETDAERLDVWNGLLLAPHLDAAFDRGFFTLSEVGEVIVSSELGESDRRVLGLSTPLRLGDLRAGHLQYLVWHRQKIFRR